MGWRLSPPTRTQLNKQGYKVRVLSSPWRELDLTIIILRQTQVKLIFLKNQIKDKCQNAYKGKKDNNQDNHKQGKKGDWGKTWNQEVANKNMTMCGRFKDFWREMDLKNGQLQLIRITSISVRQDKDFDPDLKLTTVSLFQKKKFVNEISGATTFTGCKTQHPF